MAPIEPLELAEDEAFPAIENLTLSGYHPTETERKHWKEKFPWSRLKALSLGLTETHDFLGPIVGHVQNLSSFTISAYNGSGLDAHPELESLLTSFDTLKYLTVKEYSLSIGTVAHHSNLERLIHTLETRERERHTLWPGEINHLDQKCPKLRFLEVDIRRGDEWPLEIIEALATGFGNLRRLRLHVGLDVHQRTQADSMARLEPVLNTFSAHEFAHAFFYHRKPSTTLNSVTLKTGENLRRYPGAAPKFRYEEKRAARTFHIWPPREKSDGFKISDIDVEFDEL